MKVIKTIPRSWHCHIQWIPFRTVSQINDFVHKCPALDSSLHHVREETMEGMITLNHSNHSVTRTARFIRCDYLVGSFCLFSFGGWTDRPTDQHFYVIYELSLKTRIQVDTQRFEALQIFEVSIVLLVLIIFERLLISHSGK